LGRSSILNLSYARFLASSEGSTPPIENPAVFKAFKNSPVPAHSQEWFQQLDLNTLLIQLFS